MAGGKKGKKGCCPADGKRKPPKFSLRGLQGLRHVGLGGSDGSEEASSEEVDDSNSEEGSGNEGDGDDSSSGGGDNSGGGDGSDGDGCEGSGSESSDGDGGEGSSRGSHSDDKATAKAVAAMPRAVTTARPVA
eukprot:XP_008666341.1 circumsporozoite protein-like [Zea mays]